MIQGFAFWFLPKNANIVQRFVAWLESALLGEEPRLVATILCSFSNLVFDVSNAETTCFLIF
jgi:hypothetical protein